MGSSLPASEFELEARSAISKRAEANPALFPGFWTTVGRAKNALFTLWRQGSIEQCRTKH